MRLSWQRSHTPHSVRLLPPPSSNWSSFPLAGGGGTARVWRAARKCAYKGTSERGTERGTPVGGGTARVQRGSAPGAPPPEYPGPRNTTRCYRGTSLIRDGAPLGPYSRTLAATWRQRYCTLEGAGRRGSREQRGSAPGAPPPEYMGERNTTRCYRGTSLIRNSAPLGTYRSLGLRV